MSKDFKAMDIIRLISETKGRPGRKGDFFIVMGDVYVPTDTSFNFHQFLITYPVRTKEKLERQQYLVDPCSVVPIPEGKKLERLRKLALDVYSNKKEKVVGPVN